MNADWSSSGGVPVEPVRGEHLVPVVADPAAGPAVPAAARQPHRVGVGRPEERLGRRGAPVDAAAGDPSLSVRPSRPTYTGSGSSAPTMRPEAQVQAEAAQRAQPGGQPVDLQVPVHRLLARAAGRPALGVEAVGQVGDRLLEALRDGREVLLVAGDQRRVGLGGEVVGKVERTGGQRGHVMKGKGWPHSLSHCFFPGGVFLSGARKTFRNRRRTKMGTAQGGSGRTSARPVGADLPRARRGLPGARPRAAAMRWVREPRRRRVPAVGPGSAAVGR